MTNNLEDLKVFLNDKKFKKILIFCGKKSFEISGAKKFIENFIKDKETEILFKNSEIPIFEELINIVKKIKYFKPDLILAIGGGSVIDYAKIANVIDVVPNLKNLIINYAYPYKKKFTNLAVIPTTAGSGAEVTSNAVIYVDGIKHSFESDLLIPDYFFLIPDFLVSSPRSVKSSAGFDAIAQALESLVSKKSNDMSLDYATKALKILSKNYLSFLENPSLRIASEMSIAANLAGKAISISKTTAPHAVSYPFTSIYNISHGHSVSLFFENFFKFTFDNIDKSQTSFDITKRFEIIFKIFEVKNINEFNSKISLIKKTAKLEDNLKSLNIDIIKNSKKIFDGINLLRLGNNPVKLDKNDIFNIITNNN